MVPKHFERTLLIGTLLFLSGCASGGFLNEGSNRVRTAGPTGPVDPSNDFETIFFTSAEEQRRRVSPQEYFSIKLVSAYICDFRESRSVNRFLRDGSNPSVVDAKARCTYGGLRKPKKRNRTTRGEIAIVAHLGEISSSRGLTVNPADAESNGRVIYYNNDVRESGQLINTLNNPIYGPKKYGGKGFIFELWMLELDNNENDRMKALLDSLSGIGGASYPPSVPILSVLNTLGGALLSGNQDDVEAHFQMTFDAPSGDSGSQVPRLPLAEGYYAVVREEDRDLDPDWDQIAVNRRDGVLCWAGKSATAGCEETYRDRTWFLFRVAKESEKAALDLEFGERVGQFVRRLDEFESADLESMTGATNDLQESLKILVCESASDQEREELGELCSARE